MASMTATPSAAGAYEIPLDAHWQLDGSWQLDDLTYSRGAMSATSQAHAALTTVASSGATMEAG